ncbi:MAG: hypothetical protein A2521_16060 [Deltaproteobacteria bacterium RIFOXYD12_FULL_57_12]|nr:MAG: hypothetical protein A2521_16060 [Deltaproteobacteria bacterium RIFOXYD12_FULL_57_12]
MPERLALSDEDIYEAMKHIQGYLDITASDFKELYQLSYRHALERMSTSIPAADIMSRQVVSVTVTTPLTEVATRMANASVSGVPVLDDNERIAGIISERDFLKHMGAQNASFMSIIAACLEGKGCAAVTIRKGVARDIMSCPVVSVKESAPLAEVATTLSQHRINRVPVLADEGNRLVGIITRADLAQAHILS